MPTLAELKAKLENIRAQLPGYLLEAATVVSLTGKALAERTIKDKGFGEQYSNNPVPVWFFEGKELNAAGQTYIDQKKGVKKKRQKKGEPDFADGMGTWKEFRGAQGLPISFVDLSYSNEMWSGMFPREAYQNGNQFIAPLAHNNKEGQNKMNWNRDRFGDFVGKALTGDNFDAMGKVGADEIYRIIIERNDL